MSKSSKRDRVERTLQYWETLAEDVSAETFATLNKRRNALYKALRRGLQIDALATRSAQLVLKLYPLGERGGYLQEWILLLNLARQAIEPTQVLFCRLSNQLGYSYFLENQLDDADKVLQDAQRAECGALEQLITRFYQALVLIKRQSYGAAEEMLLDTIGRFRQQGAEATRLLGSSCLALSNLYRKMNRIDESVVYGLHAVDSYRQIEDVTYTARAYFTVAIAYISLQQYEKSLEAFALGEVLVVETISRLDQVHLHLNRGVVYCRQKDWPRAQASFRKIDIAYLEEKDDKALLALINYHFGFVADKLHRHQEAVVQLRHARAFWDSIDYKYMLPLALSRLAEALIHSKQLEEGLVLWAQSLDALRQAVTNPEITLRLAEIDQFSADWYKQHKCG